MRRMLLRSRVVFEVQSRDWALAPVAASDAGGWFDKLPERPGDCITNARASLLRWWSTEARYLLLAQRSELGQTSADAGAHDSAWRRADIAAGLAAIYPATRESFVPQMLNLDLLQAVSYDKGCYVGQEVVARARRAQVRRRMFRFSSSGSPPCPGTHVLLAQGEVGAVVDSAATPSGCELLAVVELEHSTATLQLPDGATLSALALPYLNVAARTQET